MCEIWEPQLQTGQYVFGGLSSCSYSMVVQHGLIGVALALSACFQSGFWSEVQDDSSTENQARGADRKHKLVSYDRIESFSPGKAHRKPGHDSVWLWAPTCPKCKEAWLVT